MFITMALKLLFLFQTLIFSLKGGSSWVVQREECAIGLP